MDLLTSLEKVLKAAQQRDKSMALVGKETENDSPLKSHADSSLKSLRAGVQANFTKKAYASRGSASTPLEVSDDSEQPPHGPGSVGRAAPQQNDKANVEAEHETKERRLRKREKARRKRLRKERERAEQSRIEQLGTKKTIADQERSVEVRRQEILEEDRVDEHDLEDEIREDHGTLHANRCKKITHPPVPDIPAAYRTALPPPKDGEKNNQGRAEQSLMVLQRLEEEEEPEQESREQGEEGKKTWLRKHWRRRGLHGRMLSGEHGRRQGRSRRKKEGCGAVKGGTGC